MLTALKQKAWLLSRKCDDCETRYFCTPSNTYLPEPELDLYFAGNASVHIVAEEETEIDWRQFGAQQSPKVSCSGLQRHKTSPSSSVVLNSQWGYHRKGLQCFDPDTTVDGLEHALTTITVEKAIFIWNEILPPVTPFIHGRVLTATRQDYTNATTSECDSTMGTHLKQKPWVPTREGEFRLPHKITVAEMHEELRRNEGLIEALGVLPDPAEVARSKKASQQKLVSLAGFNPDLAALLIENKDRLTPEMISRALEAQAANGDQPEFPASPVINPERRTGKIQERAGRGEDKTFDRRERSVRGSHPSIDPKLALRALYTNTHGITVCQMCRNAMPFRLPNNDYYFDAVQISDQFAKEEASVYLALCPICAAKYKVLVKTDPGRVETFVQRILQTDDLTVPAESLNGTFTIRFVEKHLHDLKAALPEIL